MHPLHIHTQRTNINPAYSNDERGRLADYR